MAERMQPPSKMTSEAVRAMLDCDRRMGLKDWPIKRPVVVRARRASAPAQRGQGPRGRVGQGGASSQGGTQSQQLQVLDENSVRGCTLCGLSKTRTQTVFGQGNASARLVFVGEAPGFEEDKQGLTFVGRAGQLLTKMIIAMGLSREQVFICNVLKCRPPGNRYPAPDEIEACQPYLREQLRIIHPEVIVTLGAPASKTLLNSTQTIGKLRGRFHEYHLTDASGETSPTDCIPLMPTYHPAYLLRSPGEKGKTWSDLQMVMAKLGLKSPGDT